MAKSVVGVEIIKEYDMHWVLLVFTFKEIMITKSMAILPYHYNALWELTHSIFCL